MCGSAKLYKFLDLGEQPLANAFLEKEDLYKPEPKFPLEVYLCEDCSLAQLIHVVNPELLFRNYVYFSMGMPKLSSHFREYAEDAVDRFATDPEQLVVEIGSNDGILLSSIKDRVRVLGIDPARNIAAVANERGVETLPEFFGEQLAEEVREKYGPARIIIGNNVVAHINDHRDLLRGVKILLDNDGVFIFEAPYLADMFDNLTFDTIYHEHLSYLAVRPLARLFAEHGMEVFDVRTYPVQGLSLRVYAGLPGRHAVESSVARYLAEEERRGFHKFETYQELARRVANLKEEVVGLLRGLKAAGKRIGGYGAPAKGNTLLNYYNIGPDLLDYLTEEMPSKIGRHSPGMRIPVVHIEESKKNPPDAYLLLAWNYHKAIAEKEADFRARGGKFVMPIGAMREL